MEDNRRDQQSMQDDKMQQGQRDNASRNQNFDNPQQGAKWDNYQTRTLSSESDPGEKNAGKKEDESGTVIIESGLGIDE